MSTPVRTSDDLSMGYPSHYQYTPCPSTSTLSLDSLYVPRCPEGRGTFYQEDEVSKINVFAPEPLFLTPSILPELFSEGLDFSKQCKLASALEFSRSIRLMHVLIYQVTWIPVRSPDCDDIFDKNFIVIRTINEGLFSSVHLVKRRLASDKYALKRSTLPSTGVSSALNGMNEARILALLGHHKNIIEHYFLWVQNGYCCILTKVYSRELVYLPP